MKELLLEGYDSSRLIVVIPFVCKVLEQGYASRVFAPPNPWLMAIMKLLAELYHYANLKLNLKFEIEVLCKKLKLDIKDIQPTDILRNRPLKDYPSKAPEVETAVAGNVDVNYSNIAAFITFNPNIPLFNSQPALKRIVHVAMDRAIREVASFVFFSKKK
jgi:CCR4-NOT transcription complex subunit 1